VLEDLQWRSWCGCPFASLPQKATAEADEVDEVDEADEADEVAEDTEDAEDAGAHL
jgi:hypothetical protein